MLAGRARAAGVGAVAACALAAAGCGASNHPNEARPAVSARISVTISPKAVIVQPGSVGDSPEANQQIPQNEGQPQPRIKVKEPLAVTIVAANQTGDDTHLVIRGRKKLESETVFARSPATIPASLPSGSYTVLAAGLPGARPGHFTVGPFRASSQNDLLLP